MVKNGKQITHHATIAKAFTPTDISLKSLRNRILLRLLLVSLVPLLALSVYFHHQFKSTLENRSRLQLETIASGHRQAVDRFIQNKISALQGIVQSNLISFPPTKTEIEKVHKVMKSLDDSILDVGVFDGEGRHISYSGPYEFLEGKNYSKEEWFLVLLDTDKPYFISDVYLGYRDQPHFVIAVKTFAENAQWVLRLTVNLQKFQEFVDDVGQIEGAHAFIVNDSGVCQVVPKDMGTPLHQTPIWRNLKPTRSNLYHAELGDETLLVVKKRLTKVDWNLAVIQPKSVAYAPINHAEVIVVLILGLGVLITVLASLLATATLVRKYASSEAKRGELVSQLVQAGKMGTMGEMAAGVAHEINNPLAIILSEIGVMEDSLDPAFSDSFDKEDFRHRLNSIREESNRCRSIIHKLLGFARRNKPQIKDCELQKVIYEAVELVEKELSLENITIDVQLHANLPMIHTDEGQLKQVLINLIRNGADAIGKDGVITVSAHDKGKEVSIMVSDTGGGIAEEHIDQIFMPFFTTKEVGKGTGLGLSITHGIVTSLGGTIHVTSEVGKGATFEILAPKTHD